MLLDVETKKIIENKKINLFYISNESKNFGELDFRFVDNSINELISFVELNNIKNIYCGYNYYDENDYLISDIDIKSMKKKIELFNLMSTDVYNYNDRTLSLDFNIPHAMYLFCKYEGDYFYIKQENKWLDELQLTRRQDMIRELINKYNDDYTKKLELIKEQEWIVKQKKLEILEEEFKSIVIKDENFIKASNKSLRGQYIRLLLSNPSMSKYKELFMMDIGNRGITFTISCAEYFIEQLWKEMK